MTLRSLPLILLASPLLAQQSPAPDQSSPLPGGVQMPAPAPIDAELDDAVPFEGVRLEGDATSADARFTKGLESPLYLGFASKRFYPALDERIDPLLVAQVRTLPTDGRPAPTAFAYVMFSRRMTPARLATLENLGCRLLGFHPGYCMKVALAPELIDEVGALEFVRWIGVPRLEQKLSPGVLSGLTTRDATQFVDLIVNVHETDLCADTTRELITTGAQRDASAEPANGADPRNFAYRVQSNGWQQRALESAGALVGDYVEKDSVLAFHVRAPLALARNLAELDFVQFVEEALPIATTHEESMPMVNADSTRYYVNGATSQTVVAGEIDSGLSTGHADLYYHLYGWGWDFSGSGTGAWYDACGHGTHVAGTLTGDGSATASKRGVAPGLGWGGSGRFQQSKIFAGCGSQVVNLASVMSVMRTGVWDNLGSFSPRPHVINNSWGSSQTGAIGSEFDARLVDDEVFWQQQMYVFAAGNDANASTIGTQGNAKNAFTVGSVEDSPNLGTTLGERSSFSSQGPAGDSRWKPNVCAPGNWIDSLQANTWDQYTGKQGTSMAAPHVTGIAALMCDQFAWMRYRPSALAATLMASAVTRSSQPIYNHFTPGLNQYGAGRVDAFLANFASYQTGWNNWTFDLGAGQGTYADFYVAPGTTRVVICTNWNEVAASAGASSAAVNDWDLYIDFEPFAAGLNTGEFTAGTSSYDTTEIRYLENPAVGWYRWKINPYSATSTGRFGVTVFSVTGQTQPQVQVSLSQSSAYTQPFTPISVSASVYNPGYLASAASIRATGQSWLDDSYVYLNDGPFADFQSSSRFGLGNILSLNSRYAYFEPVWSTEGFKVFTAEVRTDNGPTVSSSTFVTVDGTPPTAVSGLVSTSHPVGIWSCGSDVTMAWQPASDAIAGVAGYSVVWDYSSTTDPDGFVDTTAWSWNELLVPDAGYYFHVRAIDNAGLAGPTEHLGPFYFSDSPAASYCAPKMNSQFCLPYMTTTGHASVNGPDDFHLQAFNILNQKSGLLFWSNSYSNVPFQGGIKCVGSPLRRTAAMSSGGSPSGNDCSGTFDLHWSQAYAAANGVVAGDWTYCQFWYRDPADPYATGLTDAVQFLTCEQ